MAILSMEEEIETFKPSRLDELDAMFSLNKEPIDNDVAVILLKIDYKLSNGNKKSFDYRILGKTLTEWTSLAFDACPVLEIEVSQDEDILDVVKPNLSDKKYTAVFFADTPLMQRATFLSIIDYAKTKRMNVLKLERGYVFVTDYLRTAEKIYSSTISTLNFKEDFLKIDNMEKFVEATSILKSRIINFHLKNGVEILDTNSISIDADVVIGDNVTIYPQNVLANKTIIGNNVKLLPGNTIINSKIGNDCQIMHSVIETSKIRDNTRIEPFTYILDGQIKE